MFSSPLTTGDFWNALKKVLFVEIAYDLYTYTGKLIVNLYTVESNKPELG